MILLSSLSVRHNQRKDAQRGLFGVKWHRKHRVSFAASYTRLLLKDTFLKLVIHTQPLHKFSLADSLLAGFPFFDF